MTDLVDVHANFPKKQRVIATKKTANGLLHRINIYEKHQSMESRSPLQTKTDNVTSHADTSQTVISVNTNRIEGDELKLPDIQFRNGHTVENNPYLSTNGSVDGTKAKNITNTLDFHVKRFLQVEQSVVKDDSNNCSNNDQDQKVLNSVGAEDDYSLIKSKLHDSIRRLRKNGRLTQKHDGTAKRQLAPVVAAIQKRWVSTTRPPSHSEDKNLFIKKHVPAHMGKLKKVSVSNSVDSKDKDGQLHKTFKEEENTKQKLLKFLDTDISGSDAYINTLVGQVKVTYLDYIASGRPLKCIESYIRKHVMPFYANTHTTVSFTGMQTTLFREEARDIIRKSVNAGDDDYVIFSGSGVTTAINKLVHVLNIPARKEEVFVFVGPYEHHSNILPWMHTKSTVIRIRQNADGVMDVHSLASHLETIYNDPKRTQSPKPVIIGSFSAASNVTGILSPVEEISSLIHRYNGYVIWDYACAGPYIKIDMNPPSEGQEKPYKDAVVISPHKFVGGPGTPGILIAKKWMFQNTTPHNVGGGTVLFVRRDNFVYHSNPEHSEEGGTPAILESIRAGLVFKLKDAISPDYIMKREEAILKKAVSYLKDVPGLVILGNTRVHRLAILPFLFYQEQLGRFIHHDFMAILFNDVFGIQVRSGCACAAPYGLDLLGMSEDLAMKYEKFIANPPTDQHESSSHPYRNVIYKPGFVRFSLPYFITTECLDFVLAAIHLTSMHGWAMLPQYKYNRVTGKWSPRFKKANQTLNTNHLSDVEFKSGTMKVNTPSSCDKDWSDSFSDSTSSSNKSVVDYEAILYKAESLFQDALAGAYDCEETEEEKGETEEHEDELRWFVKPVEAANLIHGRDVASLDPDDLPYMPGALASKIKYCPKGHRGRGSEMDRDFILEYHPDR